MIYIYTYIYICRSIARTKIDNILEENVLEFADL